MLTSAANLCDLQTKPNNAYLPYCHYLFPLFLPALSLPHPFLGTYQGHAAPAAPKQLQVTSRLWQKSPYQEG